MSLPSVPSLPPSVSLDVSAEVKENQDAIHWNKPLWKYTELLTF